MKAAQHFDRVRNGLGSEKSGAEHAVAQARDLAVFVNLDQAPSGEAGDFQTHRVRSNIDRGKSGHGEFNSVQRQARA